MSTTQKTEGFTETMFAAPYAVTIFPNSNHFEPTPGVAVGIEKCNTFGSERLIVRYDSIPKRKVTGQQTPWPRGIVYLAARDVLGWKEGGK